MGERKKGGEPKIQFRYSILKIDHIDIYELTFETVSFINFKIFTLPFINNFTEERLPLSCYDHSALPERASLVCPGWQTSGKVGGSAFHCLKSLSPS